MRAIYLNRDLVASLPSIGLAVFLIAAGVKEARTLKPKYDEPVKLEIIDIAEIPPPPAPPAPPEPKPEQKPEPKQEPKSEPKPEPRPEPKPEPTRTPSAEPAPVAATQTAPAPAAQQTPQPERPPQPQSQPQPAPQRNVEAEYIGRLRAYLNSIKRYPTGRAASLQRPRGTVKVWFVLRRDGSLVDVGIENSSNSMLLDEAARKTITLASPQAFPEEFRPGEATHRFTVELEFMPAG